ncbi:PfkB family carbohydrate kinase [Microbacterium sp.]|uniref:carbohydrate kinase family protein n=1 Tax=Microbacterium sp. TaxID=51671 RepID=UPI0028115B6E|nr:PfkB family carbohydrate kinase [Microbacterium sp.]
MTEYEWDVALAGPVFLDYGFAELDSSPHNGTEVFADVVGISPGGIANLAVASARLGLRTSMAAPFGSDAFGDWCWTVLCDQEGIDLSSSRRIVGMPTPMTVALSSAGDRSMITYAPGVSAAARSIHAATSARVIIADLKSLDAAHDSWWRRAADDGTRIFADIGWDSSERWLGADLAPLDACYAFTPNEREAMAYTRAADPVGAARALAERVPLVVVTRGADGVVAIDSASGIEVIVPALSVPVLDPTGAGDVFTAALVRASLLGLALHEQAAFAVLASGIAVTRRGSALSAPGWGDISRWWRENRDSGDAELRTRYDFLDGVIPPGTHAEVAGAPDALPSSVLRDVERPVGSHP